MRVLKGKILVSVKVSETNSLINTFEHIREGEVYVSGSDQIKEQDYIMFGNNFEGLDLITSKDKKLLLMDEDNVKIIYDPNDRPSLGNILSFVGKTA